MENKNQPAYPRPKQVIGCGEDYQEIPAAAGLTKREVISAMVLQGLLANSDYNCPSDPKKIPTTTSFAQAALHYTDALLKELEK